MTLRDQDFISECHVGECSLRSSESGCRASRGVPAADLDLHFRESIERQAARPDGDACPMWFEIILPHFVSLRRRSGERDSGWIDAAADCLLLLERLRQTRGELEVPVDYLLKAGRNMHVDRRRREVGRVRCGACRHYSRSMSGCSLPGADATDLEPTQNPRRLDPPCGSYKWVQAPLREGEIDLASVPGRVRIGSKLASALRKIASTYPEEARVLERLSLDGRGMTGLSRETGASMRLVRFQAERARRLLEHILEDQP